MGIGPNINQLEPHQVRIGSILDRAQPGKFVAHIVVWGINVSRKDSETKINFEAIQYATEKLGYSALGSAEFDPSDHILVVARIRNQFSTIFPNER